MSFAVVGVLFLERFVQTFFHSTFQVEYSHMNIFIICGYGIPKDIASDQNYSTYLNIVFNRMYERSANQKAVVMSCGGPTKCDLPYDGTEAEVISDYLVSLMQRPETVGQTKEWGVMLEDESLSTLENLLFAKKLLDDQGVVGEITIFCEKTRQARVEAFADAVFDQKVFVDVVDFDISKNRYLDPDVINTKEALALKEGLWTLEESERLEKHHEFFQKKLAFLRRRQTEGLSHVDAVKEWFENQESVMRELMPDHPLLADLGDS